MSMIRHPAVYTATPLRTSLVLGRMFSYALRDATDPRRMPGLPPLVKTVDGGSAESGSAYADATFYQLPTDCGNTGNIVDFVAEEDDNDLYLDQVLTLVGMEVGEQIIVAMDVGLVDHADTSGTLWCWGTQSDNSMLAWNVNSGGNPRFLCRPKGSTASAVTTTPTSVGTDLFTAFNGVGRFSVVMSIVPTAASGTTQEISIELLAGNGTLSSQYTATGVDVRQVANNGTANPGISGGVAMSSFVGLSVGSQGVVGGPNANFWGRGATNIGKIDVIHGWRGTYDAGLAAAVLAEMYSTHELDYPPSLAAAP